MAHWQLHHGITVFDPPFFFKVQLPLQTTHSYVILRIWKALSFPLRCGFTQMSSTGFVLGHFSLAAKELTTRKQICYDIVAFLKNSPFEQFYFYTIKFRVNEVKQTVNTRFLCLFEKTSPGPSTWEAFHQENPQFLKSLAILGVY